MMEFLKKFPHSLLCSGSLIIQGLQSLSGIINLILTDRKKAIGIKIMVNPVKGRWEIYA